MSDADGDSQMHSSPSSAEDETETMFPAANDPPTPTANSLPIHPFNSELSPPTSQDPPNQRNGAATEEDVMDYTSSQQNGNGAAVGEQMVTREAAGRTRDMGKQPGSAWSNTRAAEEYTRAMESVVDQKFSLREFGDPFDLSDMHLKK
ncbi:MAG: hypothetical protein M1830_010577 [Pleopsidium flavum]|nr:MAG: hypothetical protein M1830_010577 [Pleopsidium flavum]